jgi:hypothetical protein
VRAPDVGAVGGDDPDHAAGHGSGARKDLGEDRRRVLDPGGLHVRNGEAEALGDLGAQRGVDGGELSERGSAGLQVVHPVHERTADVPSVESEQDGRRHDEHEQGHP